MADSEPFAAGLGRARGQFLSLPEGNPTSALTTWRRRQERECAPVFGLLLGHVLLMSLYRTIFFFLLFWALGSDFRSVSGSVTDYGWH